MPIDPTTGINMPARLDQFAMPQIGWSAPAPGVVSAAGGTPPFQTLHLVPYVVGGAGMTIDAFLLNVSTAFTGGTAPVENVGIYPDALGLPNTTNGPLRSAQLSLASLGTGIKVLTFTTPLTLPSGLFWIGTLKAGTADTTAGQFAAIGSSAWELPLNSGVAPGTLGRAYQIGSQTALPTTGPLSYSTASVATIPVVNLRRSA